MALSRSFVTVIVALVACACHLAQGQTTGDTCDPGIARLCLGISNQTDCGTNDLCQFYQDQVRRRCSTHCPYRQRENTVWQVVLTIPPSQQETCGPAATCKLNANIIEWPSVQITFTNDKGTASALAVDGGDCEVYIIRGAYERLSRPNTVAYFT
jgi:hypothetical protein